jgi:PAS domain S-box-containing protein
MQEHLAELREKAHVNFTCYLKDGGEMGELIRHYDWSATSIGSLEYWPQTLLTTLGIILHSKFPMFLFWGSEHLCFYNDAYRPSLGDNGKHPFALGKKGEEVWPEIWSDIKPLINDVLSGKGATWSEDQLLPIFRNGQMEDVYWTFSYSPVIGEAGKAAGVFVTCVETTEKVYSAKKTAESEMRVSSIVKNAPFSIGVYSGKDMRIEMANQTILDTWGKGSDVIGKLYTDILPELQNQEVFKQLDRVYATGIPFHARNQRIDFAADGKLRPYYFNYSFTPLYDTSGQIYGVMNTAADVTDLNLAQQKAAESEQRFRRLVKDITVGVIVLTGADLIVDIANEMYCRLTHKSYNEIIGKPIFDIIPESEERFRPIIEHVRTTGESLNLYDYPFLIYDKGVKKAGFVNLVYEPYKEEDGLITGVIILMHNVTEEVNARKKTEEAEEKARLAINSAELGVYEIIYATDKMTSDARFNEIWGFNYPVTRAEYAAVIYKEDFYIREQAHKDALTSGQLHYQVRIIRKDNSVHWVRVKGKLIFDDKGNAAKLIGVVQDITEQVTAHKKIEESERNIRNMIIRAPVAMSILRGPLHIVEIANNKMFELWGKEKSELINKPVFEGLPEAKEQGLEQLLRNVYTTGKRFVANERPVNLPRNGKIETTYLNFVYEALREGTGTISGILAVAVDVTPQVIARQKIEAAEERARLAINLAELGVYETDIATNEMVIDARFQEIFDCSSKPTRQEILHLFHPEDIALRENAFHTALETGVLDYEARIIKKDKSIHWIRGKGKVIYSDKGAPLKLLGVAQDITQQKQFAEALEKKVQERTKELAEANLLLSQSNIELNQFAYIASHDLQEPLRKVRTFTELMQLSLGEIPEKAKNYVNKIQSSIERMQTLINDVLKFSLLSKEREKFENVNLNYILKSVLGDYELLIEQKGAKTTTGNLPVIEAIPLQMNQLFTNLISNALKFSSKERLLEITISSRQMPAQEVKQHKELNEDKLHYVIEFKDNGIGFNQENAKQIFTIFQRLHGKNDYAGTGIGLAMCKKITANHHGTIYANAYPDEGASFIIILPQIQYHAE